MGQVIEIRRSRRPEEDLCRMVLILDELWATGDSRSIHRCIEQEGHPGPHQCYCGTVYRADGATWVPSLQPGFSGGAWKHDA